MRSTSEKKLELPKVFEIAPSWATQFYWAQVPGLTMEDRSRIFKGLYRPESPVVLEVDKGGRPGDFVWNSHGLVVASLRVPELFKREGYEKWSTFPVEVRVQGGTLPGFTGVSVLGSAGPIDYDQSRVEWYFNPDGSRRSIRSMDGLYFDPSKWDGSDIFCVDDLDAFLVTDRVVRALRKAKISNWKARPLGEYRF